MPHFLTHWTFPPLLKRFFRDDAVVVDVIE